MNKAEKTRSGLIFPLDNSSEEISHVKRCLQKAGFSDADATWLLEVFRHPDCFGEPDGDSVFTDHFTNLFESILPGIVERLEEPNQTEEDRQSRQALLFSFLLGFGPIYSEVIRPNVQFTKPSDSSDVPQWVVKFQRNGNFRANLIWHKLIEIRDSGVALHFNELVPFLFPEGVPLEIVNLELLNPIQQRGWSSNDFQDPKQLEYWLIWRFRADTERRNTIRLDTLLKDFADFPEDVLGDKVLGLLNAIGYAMGSAVGRKRLDPLNHGWGVVADELIPFLELLTEKQPELNQKRSSVLKAWWRLSKTIYGWSMGGLESELSGELRNKLVESAARHIGILRSILRETPEVFKEEDSSGTVADFYEQAFEVLLVFGAPWKCLKPLLLAFTEMTVQAVTPDLRAWPELGEEPPPHPYSQIPLWIAIAMYPQNLRSELDRDPHLQELREEFAKFCIGRLRTKTKHENPDYTDEDFVEPRQAWRRCYVQTLSALRINPGGRAHRTLFWLSKNDPDEKVRELAQRAHKQVRHLDRQKPNLDEGASPRRPLFEAFWWLRQAHLLTLGEEIDEPGALRTRRKELHRTREKSDRLNWKA